MVVADGIRKVGRRASDESEPTSFGVGIAIAVFDEEPSGDAGVEEQAQAAQRDAKFGRESGGVGRGGEMIESGEDAQIESGKEDGAGIERTSEIDNLRNG